MLAVWPSESCSGPDEFGEATGVATGTCVAGVLAALSVLGMVAMAAMTKAATRAPAPARIHRTT
jgi:hypothetical protein